MALNPLFRGWRESKKLGTARGCLGRGVSRTEQGRPGRERCLFWGPISFLGGKGLRLEV